MGRSDVISQPFEDESRRLEFASREWRLPAGVSYLNHGSFGPTPERVLQVREDWLRRQAANPMDFFLRRLEPALDEAAAALAKWIRCDADNLVFVPNATAAMNIVAANTQLQPGDEVLLNDHEYGAVLRIWGQTCQQAGARTVLARLPHPLGSADEVVEALFNQVTPQTRLIVVSHVTSPTALVFPVRQICERAQQQGIAVCVDGPHAVAMLDLDLAQIPCDFYTASCHKWLSAPLGSGFLYVRSRHKQGLRPNVVSWGRSLMGNSASWKDEFHWPGTFDPTSYLAIPAAIDLLKEYGVAKFREESGALCAWGRDELLRVPGSELLTVAGSAWNGTMVTLRLPVPAETGSPHQTHPLQAWLWKTHQIEIPVIRWRERVHIRLSCHLYNSREQIRRLRTAIEEWRDQKATQIS